MRAGALLVVALVLAGCSSDDGKTAATGTPASQSMTATAGANGTAMVAAPVVTATAISWAGHTKEGAWVCSDQEGTGQCAAGQQVAPDGQHVTAIAFEGNLTLLDVNMTWQAAPGQAGLVLAAYGNTSAGRGLLSHVRGASPLQLRLDPSQLAGLLPDGVLILMAWPEGKTPTAPSAYVDATQQPFTVEGRMETTRSPGA